MTLDEALGKITDSEVKAFFTKMVADQNSYITKLETQLKEKQTAPQSTQVAKDDITTQYLRKKMREDVVNEAVKIIVAAVGKEIYDAVATDFTTFLDKNLTPERTTVEYVVDAFNLVYGRCFARKDHPVHQVGKTATNPSGTPTSTPGTNGAQVAAVNNIIANQPPVMTGTDASAGQGLPGVQGTPVKTTRDAFSRLKDRIGQSGGNRFQ
jgi:DNA-binding ferritin-like protein (Dps family)